MTERLSTQAYTHTHVYIHIVLQVCVASLVAQTVKHLPAMWETQVQSLGLEDPLEKEMATHSSILAWRIPWTESLMVFSPWGHKESDTTERLHFHFIGIYTYKTESLSCMPETNITLQINYTPIKK